MFSLLILVNDSTTKPNRYFHKCNYRTVLSKNSDFQRMQFGHRLIRIVFIVSLIFITLISTSHAELNKYNSKLSWMVGKWRSEFSGKIVWPTVPTMTYGEELIIALAPTAKTTKAQFLNFK